MLPPEVLPEVVRGGSSSKYGEGQNYVKTCEI